MIFVIHNLKIKNKNISFNKTIHIETVDIKNHDSLIIFLKF